MTRWAAYGSPGPRSADTRILAGRSRFLSWDQGPIPERVEQRQDTRDELTGFAPSSIQAEGEMKLGRILAAAAFAAVLAWPVTAQEKTDSKKPKSVGGAQVSSVTATIEAIDTGNRQVTLKGPDGNTVVIDVPESVKRFSELKVGDKVTFRYTEAWVAEVKKAAEDSKLGTSMESSVERGKTARPSGTVARTVTATVAVEAMDKAVPSITVRSADGNTHSFRIRDPKNLEGVKVGDHIEITYKEALAIQVSTPPAAPAEK
jgi:Cu/Ag efflux protein CusF